MNKIALAPNPVFLTLQGEGALLGTPMAFVRLAGCSVGCPECDTNYSVSDRRTPQDVALWVASVTPPGVKWVWITGGEPLDHDLVPLLEALSRLHMRIALATSGHKPISPDVRRAVRWISVSPHDLGKWVVRTGDELKIVPGLNGLMLADVEPLEAELRRGFTHAYVQPCEGKPESVRECVEWCYCHPDWRMTVQAHKTWGMA